MKYMTRILLAVMLAASPVYGQDVFNKYGPVAGIQKSTGTDYHNTAAASTDVVSLWSGTCDASHFLSGNGTCAVPAGTGVTSVALTVPFSWESVSGSPVTSSGTLAINAVSGLTANQFVGTPNGSTGSVSLRSLVGADIPPINLGSTANGGVSSSSILLGTNGGTSNGFFSVSGPATSLKTFTFPNASATVLTTNAAVTVAQGGSGVATLTTHGVLLGEGTGNISAVAAMAADTLLQGQGTSADPAAVTVNNCGSSNQALSYSTSTHTFGCQTISGSGGSVTSISAGTGITLSPSPITSTGSVSVDQTFNPTWTGQHIWSGTGSDIIVKNDTGALSMRNTANATVALLSTVKGYLGSGTNVTDAAFVAGGVLNFYGEGETNPRFQVGTAVSGEQNRSITNGTGNTSVGYIGIYDQGGTRFGYFGKAGSSDASITYESDSTLKLVANNGTDSFQISTAHIPTYNGNTLPTGAGRIAFATWTVSGSTCTIVNSSGLSSPSCSRSGTGGYSITTPVGFSNNSACGASIDSAATLGSTIRASASATAITIATAVAAVSTDENGSVVCTSN